MSSNKNDRLAWIGMLVDGVPAKERGVNYYAPRGGIITNGSMPPPSAYRMGEGWPSPEAIRVREKLETSSQTDNNNPFLNTFNDFMEGKPMQENIDEVTGQGNASEQGDRDD